MPREVVVVPRLGLERTPQCLPPLGLEFSPHFGITDAVRQEVAQIVEQLNRPDSTRTPYEARARARCKYGTRLRLRAWRWSKSST